MSQRRPEKRCPECLVLFRPCRRTQVCCSRNCGAQRRARRFPHHHQMLAANQRRRVLYAQRLGARLKTLTRGAVWRLAYQRGYLAGYTAGRTAAKRRAA